MAEKITNKEAEELLNNMCYVANIAQLGTLLKQAITSSESISKKGGNDTSDLFNDINNNLAGAKVFAITAVGGKDNKEITVDLSSLTAEELSTFNSIQAGTRCCVDTSTEQDNIKIVSVDGANGKIVVENTVSALAVEDGTIDGDPTHRNYILILDYPNLGNTYNKTINAHAEGENTQALARGTHSEGRDSKAIGQYAHSEGLGTMAGYGSHSEGRYTKALGNMSHSEGHFSTAYGHNSHAEGRNTNATGYASHTEGKQTEASGYQAHAEGLGSKAQGESSHAEGSWTVAQGDFSHSEGKSTNATNIQAHAEGYGTVASAANSHAEGNSTKATGESSHSEGRNTEAKGLGSHTEGTGSVAETENSHAEGYHTTTSHFAAHAEGDKSKAKGNASHAEGYSTEANGDYSHAEGQETQANGAHSHAEGFKTQASIRAHSEGKSTIASGEGSHSEGISTQAKGTASHAEGNQTEAGLQAHAEGDQTKATGETAHAEGRLTEASGASSHAEGKNTKATSYRAHAEGNNTKATNESAHSEGYDSEANGRASHSEGTGTVANGENQHVQGKYNVKDTENKYAHIVGNGTSDTARSNAHTVDWNGNAWFSGNLNLGTKGLLKIGNREINASVPEIILNVTEGLIIDGTGVTDYSPGVKIKSLNGEIELTNEYGTHKLTEKANLSDVFLKSGDIMLADGKKITVQASTNENTSTNILTGDYISLNRDNMKTMICPSSVDVCFTDSLRSLSITPDDVQIKKVVPNAEKPLSSPTTKVIHQLSEKANLSDVLTKTNTTEFTPTGDYNPATKKYVDEHSANVQLADNLTTEDNTIALSAKQGKILNDNKADKTSVLTKDNSTEFTPTADYQPATKKYVDGLVSDKGGGDMLRSVYDKDKTGTVDDSKKLGGQLPSYYGKATDIGTLTDLNTTSKTNIVSAINEKWTGKIYTVEVGNDWQTNIVTVNGEEQLGSYSQEIEVEGIASVGQPFVDVVLPEDDSQAKQQLTDYQCVSRVTVNDGKVILKCYEDRPSFSFTIRVLVMGNTL